MMIDINDSELTYYRDNKKCIVCGKTVEYQPIKCSATCETCVDESTCDIKGKIVNVPICHDTPDETDLDCPKLLYGWTLLESRQKLTEFINKIPELSTYTYPDDKYVILQTVAGLERQRVITILEEVFGENIWLYMR